MSQADADRLDVEWGTDTCDVCEEETWLTMVMYEPVHAALDQGEGSPGPTFRHPAPQDEEAIAVCGQCLGEALSELAGLQGIEESEVAFDQVWKYLVYVAYPDYAEQVLPEKVDSFEKLSQG
jgi:hypothetical protein